MKIEKFLNLEGEISPLTVNEENQLKGGFGSIPTKPIKPRWGSNNDNCSNSSLSNNDNCYCPSKCGGTTTEG